jgi:hypothetical protein
MYDLTMADPFRITITLSAYEARKLICWAKIHGKPKATYAAQIIGARIESNFESIRTQMQDIAAREGISVEELEQRWLKEEDFNEKPPSPSKGKGDK